MTFSGFERRRAMKGPQAAMAMRGMYVTVF
jgi:hypothetical protein